MENELQHWGIKGQKWGRRRFQNKDGSLTPEGKKRYGDGEDSKSPNKPDNSWRKKDVKEMSTEELTSAIKRLELEQRYNQLNPKTVSAGKKYVTEALEKGVLPGVTNAGRKLIEEALTKAGEKALGIEKEKAKSALEALREEAETIKLTREKVQNQDWIDKNAKEKADAAASEATRKAAEKTAKKEQKAADKADEKAAKEERKTADKSSQSNSQDSNRNSTWSGTVEGEGTSKFTGWKSDKFAKEYDVDIDFTKTTMSEARNRSTTALGESVTLGLLESKPLMLPGPSNALEDKNNN